MSTQVTTQQWNAAVVEQYPWLASLKFQSGEPMVPSLTARIAIRKVDDALLDKVPFEEDGSDLSGWSRCETVKLYDGGETDCLGTVNRSYHYIPEPGRGHDGESVSDAIIRLDIARDVLFITVYEYCSGGQNDSESRELTLYRVGNFDLQRAILDRQEIARLTVQAAINEASAALTVEECAIKWAREYRASHPIGDSIMDPSAPIFDRLIVRALMNYDSVDQRQPSEHYRQLSAQALRWLTETYTAIAGCQGKWPASGGDLTPT